MRKATWVVLKPPPNSKLFYIMSKFQTANPNAVRCAKLPMSQGKTSHNTVFSTLPSISQTSSSSEEAKATRRHTSKYIYTHFAFASVRSSPHHTKILGKGPDEFVWYLASHRQPASPALVAFKQKDTQQDVVFGSHT